MLRIYTDGACSGNPGPGGWGVVMLYGENIKELSGGEKSTTNNRMELQAVIQGLRAVTRKTSIEVFSDSVYVIKGMSEWVKNWISRGWKTSEGKAVKNQDLWEQLVELDREHCPTYTWVKGHSGDKWNDRCDQLAKKAIIL